MADDSEQSELDRDLEEKRRQAAMGVPPPIPTPTNKLPVDPERQQRIQHEKDRKGKIDAAIASRRPQQAKPDTPPSGSIPLLSTVKHGRDIQRALDAARSKGASINFNPPPAVVSPTGETGGIGREVAQLRALVERLRSLVEILFRRPRTTTGGGGGGSCTGTTTTLANGTGVDAASNTYTATGTGKVQITIQTRTFWDTDAEELYGFSRTLTFAACSVSAETQYIIDTPEDCDE